MGCTAAVYRCCRPSWTQAEATPPPRRRRRRHRRRRRRRHRRRRRRRRRRHRRCRRQRGYTASVAYMTHPEAQVRGGCIGLGGAAGASRMRRSGSRCARQQARPSGLGSHPPARAASSSPESARERRLPLEQTPTCHTCHTRTPSAGHQVACHHACPPRTPPPSLPPWPWPLPRQMPLRTPPCPPAQG